MLAVIPPVIKVLALVISLGVFYWESGTADTGYLAANIAISVINAGWIVSDVWVNISALLENCHYKIHSEMFKNACDILRENYAHQ